jgi:hypothetical protein
VRGIVLLLLVANVCLAAYAQLNEWSNSPDPNFAPIKPERVKLLTPQQVAALGPSKIAQLNISCAEWGPFTERERDAVIALLNPMQLGKTLSVQRTELKGVYSINMPIKAGKGNLERTLEKLTQAGFEEARADADDKNAVSFGIFRTEELASARLKALETKGFTEAKVRLNEAPSPGVLFVVREPQQSTAAALEAARASAPPAPLNFASCRERA